MPLPSLATVDELGAWMGVTVDNEDRAEAILVAASTLVRSTTGRAWVDADGDAEEDLTETQSDAAHTVVLMVAQRVWLNPQGMTAQTSGPFSKTVAEWAAFGLELTETEKQMISLGATTGIPGLTSIRVVAPALARGSAMYCDSWWEDWDPDAVPT